MNKSTLVGAAMVAALAVTVPAVMAWSQSPPPPPPGSVDPRQPGGPAGSGHEGMRHPWGRWAKNTSPQQACVDRLARRAGFVAAMGFKLDLTPDQKPLWDKVLAATQTAQDAERKLCDTLPASAEDRGKLTVIDRMNQRQQMLQARLQGMQQTEPAVRALYDKLTPAQKAVLDHPFRRS